MRFLVGAAVVGLSVAWVAEGVFVYQDLRRRGLRRVRAALVCTCMLAAFPLGIGVLVWPRVRPIVLDLAAASHDGVERR